jgi:hypothetical protein
MSLLLATILLLIGAPPAPGGPPAEVERLIQQLGSEQFADREAASRALDAIGEPALDALRKAGRSSDAEVRRRADELLRRIEDRAATQGRAGAMEIVRRRGGRYERDKNGPDRPVVIVILFKTRVTDDEVRQLRWLSGLRYLDLSRTGVTDACLDGLRSLQGLQILDLSGTKVTEEGMADLQKALPRLKIRRRYIDDLYDTLRR